MNKTIHVLGTGPTLKYYRPEKDDFTIGVNDVNKFFPTTLLFLADPPGRFSPEQKQIIEAHRFDILYSFEPSWNYIIPFVQVKKGSRMFLPVFTKNPYELPWSYDSTFTAACIAWRQFRANVIMFWGVDIAGHPNLDHYWKTGMIPKCYRDLKQHLLLSGCILKAGSKHSPLYQILK